MPVLRAFRGLTWLFPATLLTLTAVALTGCVERLSNDGVPGVPEGFGERVPDVPLGGYLFVKPPGDDSTINISTSLQATGWLNHPMAGGSPFDLPLAKPGRYG